jgi:hypothetical protein
MHRFDEKCALRCARFQQAFGKEWIFAFTGMQPNVLTLKGLSTFVFICPFNQKHIQRICPCPPRTKL